MILVLLRAQDPVYDRLGRNATPQDIERERERLGLDRPFLAQYTDFVGRLARGDLSEESWHQPGRSVGELLSASLPPTLSITLPALALGTVLSIALGLWSAARRGRWGDRVLRLLCALSMSLSALVVVVLGQFLGGACLNELLTEWRGEPTVLFAIEGYDPGLAGWRRTCLLPVLLAALVGLGADVRFHRAALVEELRRPWVAALRARGMGPRRLMRVHVLRNALLPMITRVMTTLPYVVVGSILLETVFNVPGMGWRLVQSLATRDFPVVQAFVAVYAVVFVLCQVLTDVLYALADPRVRLR